jgi:hypothetical protein
MSRHIPEHYGRFADGFYSSRIAEEHMEDRLGWFAYSQWGDTEGLRADPSLRRELQEALNPTQRLPGHS